MTDERWWEAKPKGSRKRWLRPRNVVLLTILTLLVWGGVFLYGVMYAEPVISVDYHPQLVEMVRKKQGMPEGAENGWEVLRGLVDPVQESTARFAEKGGSQNVLDQLNPEVLYNPAARIDDGANRSEVESLNREYLQRLKEEGFFKQLNEICERPFAVRIPKEERLLDFMVPEVGKARLFTRLNLARMHIAHQEGNQAEWFEAFQECLALAQLESRQASTIEYLVGIAIGFAALDELRQELIEKPTNAAECEQFLAMLDRRPIVAPDAAFEGERILELDAVQSVFSDTGNGNGRILLTYVNKLAADEQQKAKGVGLEAWLDYKVCNLAGLFMPDRKHNVNRINAFFDAIILQAAMTRQQRLADSFDAGAFIDQTPKSYPLLGIIMPAVNKPFAAHDQACLETAGTKLMIAIELHRARNGDYPDSLANLVPSVLPELPQDPFTGKSFGYRRLAKGEDPDGRAYLLYSYGADGTDDGGKSSKNPYDALHSSKGRGTDFIINRPRAKASLVNPTASPSQ